MNRRQFVIRSLAALAPLGFAKEAGAATTSLPGYTVYHPATLSGKYPALTWGNPTSFGSTVFAGLLNFLADDGFIVVASNSTQTGSGVAMLGGIQALANNARFANVVDFNRIGALGHSQGGGGTTRAAMDARIKASCPIFPGYGVNDALNPQFVLAGEKDTLCTPAMVERTVVTGATASTVFAILKGATHLTPVSALGGSATLNYFVREWFRVYLKASSPTAFLTLKSNTAWIVKRWS